MQGAGRSSIHIVTQVQMGDGRMSGPTKQIRWKSEDGHETGSGADDALQCFKE